MLTIVVATQAKLTRLIAQSLNKQDISFFFFFFFFELSSLASNSWSDKETALTFEIWEDEKEFERWVKGLVDVFSLSLLDISSSSSVESTMQLYLFNDNAIVSLD